MNWLVHFWKQFDLKFESDRGLKIKPPTMFGQLNAVSIFLASYFFNSCTNHCKARIQCYAKKLICILCLVNLNMICYWRLNAYLEVYCSILVSFLSRDILWRMRLADFAGYFCPLQYFFMHAYACMHAYMHSLVFLTHNILNYTV